MQVGLAEFLAQTTSWPVIHDWQLLLCEILEGLEPGARLLLHKPPRYGGSIMMQRFIAWSICKDPNLETALACYNIDTARIHGGNIRNLLQERGLVGEAGQKSFSTHERASHNDGQATFSALGMLSGLIGKGPKLLVIDDPYRSVEDAHSEIVNERTDRWWTDNASNRIGEDAIVVCMFHRYHSDDFAARRIAEGGWRYVRFPAIADENEDNSDPTGRAVGELLSPRRTRGFLERRRLIDPQAFMGQFQGVPRPLEGAFFNKSDFQIVDEAPDLTNWVRTWDLALSIKEDADFTVGAKCGVAPDGTLYIADIERRKGQWPDIQNLIAECMERDGAETMVGVEAFGFQMAAVQDLFSNAASLRVPLTPLTPRGDKKQKASAWAARARAGKLRLVKGHWNKEFIAECVEFPGGRHDDQVDAVSLAMELLYRHAGGMKTEELPLSPFTYDFYEKATRQEHETEGYPYFNSTEDSGDYPG